jgi:hypothetical protein
MSGGDDLTILYGFALVVLDFLLENRGGVAVVVGLILLGGTMNNCASAAEALWRIHGLLDEERQAREKPDDEFI